MSAPPVSSAYAGLCASCAFRRVLVSGKGSRFILCELSLTDPRYVRYPRLPMLRCDGYVPIPPQG